MNKHEEGDRIQKSMLDDSVWSFGQTEFDSKEYTDAAQLLWQICQSIRCRRELIKKEEVKGSRSYKIQ